MTAAREPWAPRGSPRTSCLVYCSFDVSPEDGEKWPEIEEKLKKLVAERQIALETASKKDRE